LAFFAFLDFAYAFGDGSVGEEHEFLDELVGVFCALEVDAEGLACFVDFEADFFAVEVDGACLEASLAEALGHAVEDDELVLEVLDGEWLGGCFLGGFFLGGGGLVVDGEWLGGGVLEVFG